MSRARVRTWLWRRQTHDCPYCGHHALRITTTGKALWICRSCNRYGEFVGDPPVPIEIESDAS